MTDSTSTRFNDEFTTLDEAGRPTGYRNLDLLPTRIAPVVLRRRKEEVLTELPEQLVSRLTVPMTKKQRELHDDAEANAARILAQLRKRPLTPVEVARAFASITVQPPAALAAAVAADARGLICSVTRRTGDDVARKCSASMRTVTLETETSPSMRSSFGIEPTSTYQRYWRSSQHRQRLEATPNPGEYEERPAADERESAP